MNEALNKCRSVRTVSQPHSTWSRTATTLMTFNKWKQTRRWSHLDDCPVSNFNNKFKIVQLNILGGVYRSQFSAKLPRPQQIKTSYFKVQQNFPHAFVYFCQKLIFLNCERDWPWAYVLFLFALCTSVSSKQRFSWTIVNCRALAFKFWVQSMVIAHFPYTFK